MNSTGLMDTTHQAFWGLQSNENIINKNLAANHTRMLGQLFTAKHNNFFKSVSKDRTCTRENRRRPNHSSHHKINFTQITFHCADNCSLCISPIIVATSHNQSQTKCHASAAQWAIRLYSCWQALMFVWPVTLLVQQCCETIGRLIWLEHFISDINLEICG